MPGRVLEALTQDVRHALRAAARTPGLTLVVLLSLGLGIGVNTAVFSVVNAVLLRDMPVREAGQLVEPRSRYPGDPAMNFFSWPSDFAGAATLADVAGAARSRLQVGADGLAAETVVVDYVTGNLFGMLGVRPALGRLIGPDDDGGEAVAVIGWEFWRGRFDRDPGVLGRRIDVQGVPATVIGVARRGFDGLYVNASLVTSVWLPAGMARLMPEGAVPPGVALIARMKPGVRVEEVEAELRVLDRARIEGLAERDPRWRKALLEVTPAGGGFAFLSDRFGAQLIALMAIVALVLLVACTNVASLLAARAVSRERELAVCVALGAGRVRLVRQALTESLLLALSAAAIGAGVAYSGARAIVASWPVDPRGGRGSEPYDLALAPDLTVFAFTARPPPGVVELGWTPVLRGARGFACRRPRLRRVRLGWAASRHRERTIRAALLRGFHRGRPPVHHGALESDVRDRRRRRRHEVREPA